MNNHKQACELGEQALSDALEKIDDVDEETFRDAKSIIELLKENLSLWKEEEEQNAVEDLWAHPFWIYKTECFLGPPLQNVSRFSVHSFMVGKRKEYSRNYYELKVSFHIKNWNKYK